MLIYQSTLLFVYSKRHVKMDRASRVSLESQMPRVEHLMCRSIINCGSSILMPLEPSSIIRAQNVSQISRGRLVDYEMAFSPVSMSCTVPHASYSPVIVILYLIVSHGGCYTKVKSSHQDNTLLTTISHNS